ncbi:hypothetical protein KY310_01690 [Candidatus Woesearchaeota archaeon]|nr:hypothetical protein [Candidatus Woesearchaeota archaeon]
MEKLEAIILIIIVLAGAAGLYYYFAAGAGQATRMLATCQGDLTGNLYLGRFEGTGRNTMECRTRGSVMHTAKVQLVAVEGDAVYLAVNGEQSGPLTEGSVFLPQNSYCGIKIDEIRANNNYVQFCMADTEPVCAQYDWIAEETAGGGIAGTRQCVKWQSSADTKFGLSGQGRFDEPSAPIAI